MKKFPYNRPAKIRLDFWGVRNWENKIMYAIYKCIRIFHVSVWFYFFPFVILLFNYGQVIISESDPALVVANSYNCTEWNLEFAGT